MAYRGAEVTGIDMGTAPLDIARLHAAQHHLTIEYQQTTAEQYAIENSNAFDVVCCLEMLEHVPDPASAIHACATLAKPGGHVFFSTLNRTPKAYAVAVVGAEYIANILPRGTHDYKKFITPAELAKACRSSGLQVQRITGINYNFLTRQFNCSSNVSINYLVHAIKV